jgi:ADP-ribose pyrophosphatase
MPAPLSPSAPSELLPELPSVELVAVHDEVVNGNGFLRVRKLTLVAEQSGIRSEPFVYEVIDRKALDACVIVAHHDVKGVPHVWLLSCVRPPVAFRPSNACNVKVGGVMWELPAGLVEPGEPESGAAARELAEELGFHVDASDLAPLGSFTVPAPGFIGEVHHFFHVAVDPHARQLPHGDGSPLEKDAVVVSLPLDVALKAAKHGQIRDAKTELALRRYAELTSAKREE